MNSQNLREVLISLLATGTWDIIQSNFLLVELNWRSDLNPGSGKPKYLERVLAGFGGEALCALAERCIAKMPDSEHLRLVENTLWWVRSSGVQEISDITRASLLAALDKISASPDSAHLLNALIGNISTRYTSRHYIYDADGLLCESGFSSNERVQHAEALAQFGVGEWHDRRFITLIEIMVHPKLRRGAEQENLVNALDEILRRDKFTLVQSGEVSQYPVYSVRRVDSRALGRPKNLIFASKERHFKPVIGLADALDNDLKFLKHEETCLCYREPISDDGLLWSTLVSWYKATEGLSDEQNPRKALGDRLKLALSSEAERRLFSFYFHQYRELLQERLPALLPQVYVHYDPRTQSGLRSSERTFLIQRMDFLLLLPRRRVVIEIDGKHHYTEIRRPTDEDLPPSEGRSGGLPDFDLRMPSPRVYADTVSSDRELRLRGYDVYRFGGYELTVPAWRTTLRFFFDRLFRLHGLA